MESDVTLGQLSQQCQDCVQEETCQSFEWRLLLDSPRRRLRSSRLAPLECTPAPTNAGGNEAVTGGHVAEESGLIGIRVIPEVKSEKDLTGGNVPPVLQCP